MTRPTRKLASAALFSLVSVCGLAVASDSSNLPLMPMPARVTQSEGSLTIDGSFSVQTTGCSGPQLSATLARFIAQISRQTGIPIRGGAHPTLSIECRNTGPDYPSLGDNESYQLHVASDVARLSAPSLAGVRHGLETFLQLIAPGSESFTVRALDIDDHPRFPWRGLMLDVSRHWMPAPVIRRNLDAMAAVKFNVFHWHLSDDQGFRVESKVFPKLHELGSDGRYYTQEEVRAIVDYARDRGIRVIPEFDVPGHASSWLTGYPQLASAPGPFHIERNWGIFEPTLDVSREETYQFLDALLGEMAALFPDPYFHIGGDEVLDREWRENPGIQAFERSHNLEDSLALHAYFNHRVQQILTKHGKIMIGWDEVLSPGLATDVVIQSWRGQKSLRDAALKGYHGLLSFGYYLDHMNPASFHYAVDPLGAEAKELNAQQAALILGGEACMWTEYVTEETLESRLWPRAAAIAERLWSRADLTDPASMYQRLEIVSRWLNWFDIQHRSGYARSLDRLAGDHAPPALRVLADSVEATGIDVRQDARHYSSSIALNRLVDAARPESESMRDLNATLDRLLADPARHHQELERLRTTFAGWEANPDSLKAILGGNFLGSEILPVSENLSKTGSLALRALQFLESGGRPSPQWVAEADRQLDQFEKPTSEVVLAAVRPVRTLIRAVGPPADSTGQARKLSLGGRDK